MPGLARVLPHFVFMGMASSVCVPRVLRGQWEVTIDKQDYHEICEWRSYEFTSLQYIETKKTCINDPLRIDVRDLTEATCSINEAMGLEGMYSVDFSEGAKCSYWRKDVAKGAIYVDEFWTRKKTCPATRAEALLQEDNFDWNVLNNYESPAFKMRCTQGCGDFDCVCTEDSTAATTAGPEESTAATTAATTVAVVETTAEPGMTVPAVGAVVETTAEPSMTVPAVGAGSGGPSASMPAEIAAADALAVASAKFEEVESAKWLDQSAQWSMTTLSAVILAGLVLFALRKSRQEAVADEQHSLVAE